MSPKSHVEKSVSFTKKCPWIRGGKSHLTHPRDRNRIFLFVWLCLNIGSLQIHWLIITFLIKTAITGGLCTPPCSDTPKYRSWLTDVCPGYSHDIPMIPYIGGVSYPPHSSCWDTRQERERLAMLCCGRLLEWIRAAPPGAKFLWLQKPWRKSWDFNGDSDFWTFNILVWTFNKWDHFSNHDSFWAFQR